ncbi:MAG: hypothetical protein O3C23_00415 [bacterium]|nr:hypothetical protein [bacterium]
MANWKIQDIAPPKRAPEKTKESGEEAPQASPKRKRKGLPSLMKKVVLPLLVLMVLLIGGIHIFFAKADITLWPEARQIKLLKSITAQVGLEQLDREEFKIPSRTLDDEEKVTRLFPASSNTIKVNKASGTIRVFNAYKISPQKLVAKTRFLSEDGKLFRTPVAVTIPGATEGQGKLIPGFIDIEVTAAEPGEDYNIGPANFSLPGLSGSALFTVIYAESTKPMTGGSERQVSVVSATDIANAKDSLIGELTGKAEEKLLSQVPEHMLATKDSIVVEVLEANSLVPAGAELDQFNVSVSLSATLFMFPKTDIDTLVNIFLSDEIGEDERIASEKTKVDFQQIVVNKDAKTASLDLSVETTVYQYVDPTELKIKLRGKSKDEAGSILSSYNIFTQIDLVLWPFWVSSLPGNVDRLGIEVVVD